MKIDKLFYLYNLSEQNDLKKTLLQGKILFKALSHFGNITIFVLYLFIDIKRDKNNHKSKK